MTLNCDFGTKALVTRTVQVFENANRQFLRSGSITNRQEKNSTKTHNIIPTACPQGRTVSHIPVF